MKVLLFSFLLAQGADIGTTAVALNRGCVEQYMMPSHPYVGLAVKGGAAVTVTFIIGKKAKPTKTAKAVLIAGIASGVTGAVLNSRTIPQCSR